jgi:subfamily B ATP-binding cassette protein MsbA
MLDHRPAVQDAPDAADLSRVERGIAFRDVTFGYDDEIVLRDVSFEVRKGETIAIVGRSGAGKSTLTALLPRFYDVTAGVIEVDGLDVRRISRQSLLDRIAIVSQQTFLFNRSIADNIRYGRRDATQAEIEQAAQRANIHDFILTQEGGYDMLCGEFGGKLSGGQRQRIAIARALLKNADILILDEAMTGLDAESETLVREALAALMRGRTTFVVTHDLPTIRSADRILVLKDGRLVGNGRHEELIAQEGEYRNLCSFQG